MQSARCPLRRYGRKLRSRHSAGFPRSYPGIVWDLLVPGPSENRTPLGRPVDCIARDRQRHCCASSVAREPHTAEKDQQQSEAERFLTYLAIDDFKCQGDCHDRLWHFTAGSCYAGCACCGGFCKPATSARCPRNIRYTVASPMRISPQKPPMLKAWIEERSNRPYQGLSRESASTGHPTMPESPACETFGTFVGI
jgi:hypothetical protein